jgi:hypothetical protein
MTGLAVRPDVNRAVVSHKWEKKGQPAATRLAYCDLSTGKILSEWQVPEGQVVLDLSPDGRAILTTGNLSGRDRCVLRMWIIRSDGQLQKLAWMAHTPIRSEGCLQEPGDRFDTTAATEIRWAAFAGSDRIVSSSRMGQLRIFETENAKPVAYLEGTAGRPAVTPDGSKVALFTGNAVTLLDPVSGTVIGTKWVGPLPAHPVLAFSPDGGKLAVGGNGKLLVVSMTSGEVQRFQMPKLRVTDTGAYDKPFGWASTDLLFADGRLFDVRSSAPVWQFTGIELAQVRGSRVWICSRPSGANTSVLAGYDLPHPRASMRLGTELNRPDAFVLKKGDGVRLDVAGIPENRRAEVVASLEQRLRSLGYRADPAAAAVLFASVDANGSKAAVAYSGLDVYPYQKRPAELRLVLNDRELWADSWAVEAPLALKLPLKGTLADHLKQFPIGEPDFQIFARAQLPSEFPGVKPAASTVGTTELKGERLKSWLVW